MRLASDITVRKSTAGGGGGDEGEAGAAMAELRREERERYGLVSDSFYQVGDRIAVPRNPEGSC